MLHQQYFKLIDIFIVEHVLLLQIVVWIGLTTILTLLKKTVYPLPVWNIDVFTSFIQITLRYIKMCVNIRMKYSYVPQIAFSYFKIFTLFCFPPPCWQNRLTSAHFHLSHHIKMCQIWKLCKFVCLTKMCSCLIYFLIYRLKVEVTGRFDNIKEMVQPKMKLLSSFTHPHVVSNLYEFLSYVEHKRRYFEECW